MITNLLFRLFFSFPVLVMPDAIMGEFSHFKTQNVFINCYLAILAITYQIAINIFA